LFILHGAMPGTSAIAVHRVPILFKQASLHRTNSGVKVASNDERASFGVGRVEPRSDASPAPQTM